MAIHLFVSVQHLHFHICKHSRYKGQTVLYIIFTPSTHIKELLSSTRLPGPIARVSANLTFPWCQDIVYMNSLKHVIY